MISMLRSPIRDLFSGFRRRSNMRLKRTSLSDVRRKLKKSLDRLKKKQDNQALIDTIFYSACLLSRRRQNPELLLRKKVKKEASSVDYEKK